MRRNILRTIAFVISASACSCPAGRLNIVTTTPDMADFARTIEHDLQGPLQELQVLLQEMVAQHRPQLDEQGRDQLDQLATRVGQMRDMMDCIERKTGIGFVVDE